MDVEEILIKELRRLGSDGLYNSAGPCGCGIGDLAPCGETILRCVPAKLGEDGLYYPMVVNNDG